MPTELQLDRVLVLLQHLQVQDAVQRVLLPERLLPLLHAAPLAVRRKDHAVSVLTHRQQGRLLSWQLLAVAVVTGLALAAVTDDAGTGAGLVRVLGLAGLSLFVGACSVASP